MKEEIKEKRYKESIKKVHAIIESVINTNKTMQKVADTILPSIPKDLESILPDEMKEQLKSVKKSRDTENLLKKELFEYIMKDHISSNFESFLFGYLIKERDILCEALLDYESNVNDIHLQAQYLLNQMGNNSSLIDLYEYMNNNYIPIIDERITFFILGMMLEQDKI